MLKCFFNMLSKKRKGISHVKVIFTSLLIIVAVVVGFIGLLPYLPQELISYFPDNLVYTFYNTDINLQGKRIFIGENEYEKFTCRPRINSEYQHTGAEIVSLHDDSALAKLGIQRRDVITSLNGSKITGLLDLLAAMYSNVDSLNFISQNKVLKFEIVRDGKPISIIYNIVE